MRVILRETVPNLGQIGDIVNVADGYARNYLIPRRLAIPATRKNIKALEKERQILLRKREKEKLRAESLAEKLTTITCEIAKQVGEEGKLFGSVTAMDIAKALEEKGFVIDKRKILLEQPIKTIGEYEVPVKLHPEVQTYLKVKVVGA